MILNEHPKPLCLADQLLVELDTALHERGVRTFASDDIFGIVETWWIRTVDVFVCVLVVWVILEVSVPLVG